MKCKLSKRRSVLQCFRNFIQSSNQLFLKRFQKVIHLEQLEIITQKQQIKMSGFGNKREALNYWWGCDWNPICLLDFAEYSIVEKFLFAKFEL